MNFSPQRQLGEAENTILKFINYSCSFYPTRSTYSGQVDGFRNPMKNELETRPCLKRFQTRMQIFLICILMKQQKHVAINNFIKSHILRNKLLFTANIECNSTVSKLPKTEKAILFLNLNSRSMVATSCFRSLSTVLYASDLKWH